MQSITYSTGPSANFSAVVSPAPVSTLSSHLSTCSSGVIMICRSAYLADGASVAWLIETVFRICYSSILTVAGDTLINIDSFVLGENIALGAQQQSYWWPLAVLYCPPVIYSGPSLVF